MKNILSYAAILALCVCMGAPADAGALVLKDFPIGGVLEANDCTEEAAVLAGIAHVVVNNNGVHLKVSSATAEGEDTGTIWSSVSSAIQHQSTKAGVNGAMTTTTVFRIRLANEDSSFSVKMTSHTTVNANGDLTADFDFEDADCK